MIGFAAQRLVLALLVAVFVSLVTFGLMRFSGDMAASLAGEQATMSQIEEIRTAYGLDRPIAVQYFEWIWGVLRGDLGQSVYFREPVSGLILERIPVTMALGASALLVAILFAIPLGVAAAVWQGTWIDRVAQFFSAVGQATPSFLTALVLILIFGITLRWFPISGSTTWLHFIMPITALAFYVHPALLRLTRASMIDVLQYDYVRTARANGLSSASIILKHALRSAILPVVSVAAVQLGHLLGGSVVIETIFAINGVGYLAWESIQRGDVPVVQAILMIMAMIYVLLTLAADLFNARLDPRLRVQ